MVIDLSDKIEKEKKTTNPQRTYAERRSNGLEILARCISAIKVADPDCYRSVLEASDKLPQGTKPDSQPAKFHNAAALLE